jgi:hypothetical protein
MSYNDLSATRKSSSFEIIPASSGTTRDGSREWWTAEAERVGSDWPSIIAQHFRVCDDLRGVASFREACWDADTRKARGEAPPDSIPENWNEMSVEALMAHFIRARRRDGAAVSTVETLMLGLRERGTKALTEPAVQRRLSELSETQLREVGERLQNLKPHIAKAWDADAVVFFVSAWVGLQHG